MGRLDAHALELRLADRLEPRRLFALPLQALGLTLPFGALARGRGLARLLELALAAALGLEQALFLLGALALHPPVLDLEQ